MADSQRILVVGASGMLGHEAIRVLAPDFDVWGSCRDGEQLPDLGVPADHILSGLDAMRPNDAYELIERVKPDLVINAIGIVKQLEESKYAVPSVAVNSLWPHVLSDACGKSGARLVHASTDCVFTGSKGMYKESDLPDATDLYGRSKLLGEVTGDAHAITLRTSIIGWQYGPQTSLIGWFAAHRNEQLRGYRNVIYSGLTTTALTEVIRDVVMVNPELSGLYHVSTEPINKFDLLRRLADACGWEVDLTPADEPAEDKSLDSTCFREEAGWMPPTWDDMLTDLARTYREQR